MNRAMAPSSDCITNRPRIETWEPLLFDAQNSHGLDYSENSGFSSLLLLAADDEESLRVLVEKEKDYMPREGYMELYRARALNLDTRRDAVLWILKVNSFYGFGSLTAYLAVNYMDRFLSMHKTVKGTNAWMFQLLSVACLSLAAKMANTHVPHLLDLQIENARFIFDAQTIQRMELLILSTLQWRMRSVTPFSYVDYFVSKAAESNNAHQRALTVRAVELILSAVNELDLLEYRPSIIAAAAVLCAADEIMPLQALHLKMALPSCSNVDKEGMFGCYNLIQDITVENSFTPMKKVSGGSLSTTNSPSVVGTEACFSEKTTSSLSLTVEQYAKKRKLKHFCSSAMWVSEAQRC